MTSLNSAVNFFNLEIQCGAMQMCVSPIEDFSFEQKSFRVKTVMCLKVMIRDVLVKHVVYSA